MAPATPACRTRPSVSDAGSPHAVRAAIFMPIPMGASQADAMHQRTASERPRARIWTKTETLVAALDLSKFSLLAQRPVRTPHQRRRAASYTERVPYGQDPRPRFSCIAARDSNGRGDKRVRRWGGEGKRYRTVRSNTDGSRRCLAPLAADSLPPHPLTDLPAFRGVAAKLRRNRLAGVLYCQARVGRKIASQSPN
jgi:hypothetical protein